MDRREIDDVEAERGDVGQPRDAIVERAVAARHRALAARHHLVPGAGARPRPVDDDRDGDAAGQVAARVARSDRLGEVVRQQGFDIRDAVELPPGPVDDPLDVRIANIQLAEKFAAFLGLKREIMARLALEQHVLCAMSRTGRSRFRPQTGSGPARAG